MNWKVFAQNLAIAAGFGGVLLLSFFLHPDARGYGTHEQLYLPPCYVKFFFHIPCPACGLTTAFAHLAKGHWQAALQANFMSPLIFSLFAFLFIYSLLCLFLEKPFFHLFEHRFVPPFSSALVLGMLVCWIVKLLHNDSTALAVRSFF